MVPNRYPAIALKHWDVDCGIEIDAGTIWIPARPMGLYGLCVWRRLRLAWGVFTGRFDVVDWSAGGARYWNRHEIALSKAMASRVMKAEMEKLENPPDA